MNWIDSIKEIQKSVENNRLVIFVGSGVSANSNIPTWGTLITQMAKKIGYSNCEKCNARNSECPKDDCDCRYRFSQDEFLRIPEYFYLQDQTEKKQGYYDFIHNTLSCDTCPNSIDHAVFRILPHHIITTNYDHLLEQSKEINVRLYSVISQDKDILSENNTHYIIKMHGDLNIPKSIVLKESDYIDYEQTHTLISTFIKSLLIDHTFLFIGYSLNDYNLKLIIGWINYFVKMHGIENRPKNFIIQSESALEFEKHRLETNRIFVVNIKDIPEDILKKIEVPSDIKDFRGKMLYAYLNCIYNPKTYYHCMPLSDVLYEKYLVLNEYNKISYEDLIKIYPLGRTEFKGKTLCFFEEEWYKKISEILLGESEKNKFILNIFQKTGIDEIYCNRDDKRMAIKQHDNENMELFKLYLDNRYIELEEKLHCTNNIFKIYYYFLLQVNLPEIDEMLLKLEQSMLDGDYISILIYKLNRVFLVKLKSWINDEEGINEIERIFDTMPHRYKNVVGYIRKIMYSMDSNYAKMDRLLHMQEDKFSYNNNTIYAEHTYDKIWCLQSYAYDYYSFYKDNFLLIDYFTNPKIYFSYYLKAILCSYSPVELYPQNEFLGIGNKLVPYPLGEIEIDMFVKYTNSKDFLNWIEKYKIQRLIIAEGADISFKFISYCKSFSIFENRYMKDQLYCFVILLSKLTLCESELEEMSDTFSNLIVDFGKKHPKELCDIFPSINLFISDIMTAKQKYFMNKILSVLADETVSYAILERYENLLNQTLNIIAPYVSVEVQEVICDKINLMNDEKLKCIQIFTFRKVIPMEKYKQFLNDHIINISGMHLFYLVIDDYISYSEKVLERYIDIISKEIESREKEKSIGYPDHLMDSIKNCILLKLLGKPIDISKLEPYKEYSEYLKFMFGPENFDYSKIDTRNYMWCNFILNDKYSHFFKEHRKGILTDELGKVFLNGYASMNQQKIVYGMLLDKNQLWSYPKDILAKH